MPTMPTTAADTQAVFAFTASRKRVRLTEPTTNWRQAVEQWYTYDDPRFHATAVTTVDGEIVEWFAVRSMDDPEWGQAPKAQVVSITSTDEPAPAKPRKPATRIIDGIKWISQGDKYWKSEDGRYEIGYVDDFETECDAPHPMRFSQADRDDYWGASAWDRRHSPRFNHEFRTAMESGKRGYQCDGGEIHFYGLWVAGPTFNSDVIDRADSFVEAAQVVASFDRGETGYRG